MKRIELLSPAPNLEAGIAAINCGADALYIGASKFGARKSAGNSLEDIEKLITVAHQYSVKVYITINTIIYDNELEDVRNLIHNLYNIGADAIIVQDMAIFEMDLPPIVIHASTQANNYNLERIKFLDKLGIQRIILARELSLLEIKEISAQINTEIEVFVHGALCVSLSGNCYLSYATKSRSANRGECSQPCRMKYSMVDSNNKVILPEAYLLSLKDLNYSENLEQLLESGVTSFKIEGRLKDLNYIKNVTAYYRKKLDNIFLKNNKYKKASSGNTKLFFTPNLNKSFNRGFTDYFFDKRTSKLCNFDTPKSQGQYIGVVAKVNKDNFIINYIDENEKLVKGDGICFFDQKNKLTGKKVYNIVQNKIFPEKMSQIKQGDKIYRNFDKNFIDQLTKKGAERRISINFKIVEVENKIRFIITDEDSNSVYIDYVDEKILAENEENAQSTLKKQLSKTGSTIYLVKNIDVELKKTYYFSIKRLNQIRRNLIEKLNNLRIVNYKKVKMNKIDEQLKFPVKTIDYSYNVSNKLAEKFYFKHGVEKIEKAFEKQLNQTGKVLMKTKYCLKFQAGLCKHYSVSEKNHISHFQEPYYLVDINNNKLKIEFDCNECFMKIIL